MVWLFFCSQVAWSGPLSPGLKVNRVVPPENTLTAVKKIEVADFAGHSGAAVASELRMALQDPKRSGGRAADGSVAGDLIDLGADALGDVASEVIGGAGGQLVGGLVGGLGAGLVDELGANTLQSPEGLKVDVFEVVTSGADAKVVGSVEVGEKNETFKAKQARRDSKGKIVKDSKGNTVYQEVDCSRKIVETTLRWRIARPDGKVEAEKSLVRSARDSKCGSERGKLASKDELVGKTLAGIGPRLANEFAPYWSEVRLDFERDKSIKDALELHRKDQPEQALCHLRQVVKSDPYNVEATLALGVFHEGLGYVTEAGGIYQKAAAVNNNRSALERAKGAAARQKELALLEASYGLQVSIKPLDYSWCAAVPEGRPVELRKEAVLWSSREPTSATKLAALPKGMTVYVVQEGPDFVEVQTLDGGRGWIEAKMAK